MKKFFAIVIVSIIAITSVFAEAAPSKGDLIKGASANASAKVSLTVTADEMGAYSIGFTAESSATQADKLTDKNMSTLPAPADTLVLAYDPVTSTASNGRDSFYLFYELRGELTVDLDLSVSGALKNASNDQTIGYNINVGGTSSDIEEGAQKTSVWTKSQALKMEDGAVGKAEQIIITTKPIASSKAHASAYEATLTLSFTTR